MLFVNQQLEYYEASVATLRSGVVFHGITSQSTSHLYLPSLLSASQTTPSMARLLFNSTIHKKKMVVETSENCEENRMPWKKIVERSVATKAALCSCCWSPKAYPQFNHYNYTLIHNELFADST